MTRPVSVRGTHPGWPLNRLVSALPEGWDTLDIKDARDGQAQAYVTRCPGPSHAERTGGTRDLLLAEYPSGYLLVRCFGECDPRIVLHHFGLQVQDMSTGPDGRALARSEEDEPEPPIALPAYPVALLPDALRQLVLSGASAGLPTELVAGAGLGVASMVSMPARILPDRDIDTWQEPSTLWIVLLGQTGAGKTPALTLARRALSRLEEDADAAYALDQEAWVLARDEAKKTKEEFSTPPPKRRQITVDDITIEAFLGDLAANDGRLSVLADELRTHVRSMGRYRQRGDGGEHARWLNLWAGQRVQYRRKTGDVRVRINRPVVPVLGGLQPHLLGELGDDEDGSRARWLLHYTPQALLKTRPAEEPMEWVRFIESAYPITEQRTWYLDRAARAVWDDARDDWGALARRAESSPALASAAAKAATQSLRLTLTCAELIHPGGSGPVPPEAVRAGIAVTRYALGVWAALGGSAEYMATSRREETLGRVVDRLAAWLASRGGRVTMRELRRATPCGLRKREQIDAALSEYKKVFPGTVRDEPTPGGGPVAQVIYAPRAAPRTPATPTVGGSAANGGVPTENQQDRETSSQVDDSRLPTQPSCDGRNVGGRDGAAHVLPPTVGSAEPASSPADQGESVDPLGSAEEVDTPPTSSPLTWRSQTGRNEPYHAEPVLITTEAAWAAALPEILAAEAVGLDLETHAPAGAEIRYKGYQPALDPTVARVRLAQVALRPDRAYVVDLHQVPIRVLQPILDHSVITGHNAVFELRLLAAAGLRIPSDAGHRLFDTMLCEQILTAGNDADFNACGLDATVRRELGVALDKTEQVSDWGQVELTDSQLHYAAADAAVLLPLRAEQRRRLTVTGLVETAALENRCLPCVAWMGHAGVLFDVSRINELSAYAQAEYDDAYAELRALVGHDINPGSPKQVQALLAELGQPVASTSEEKLKQIAHPVVPLILACRHAEKRISLYGARYPTYVSPATGRIHADWKQIGSRAGRMSCTNPPLQQVPSSTTYRECFRAPARHVIVTADYSQIELRISARMSDDEPMLEAFRQGQDLHTLTAQQVLGRDRVTAEDRQAAKALNFGLQYGMEAPRLKAYARSQYGVELSDEAAAEYHRRFFAAHPGLKHRRDHLQRGSITTRTVIGRRRLNVTSRNMKLNTPVQGSGADGLKAALALLWERQDDCPGAYPILAVHDEVAVVAPEERAVDAEEWLRAAMVDGMRTVLQEDPIEVETAVAAFWKKP